MAFVDPVVGTSTNPSAYQAAEYTERGSTANQVNIFDITRSIAHEAGHTFGLSHVRTDGKTDPTPVGFSGTVNDVMSYDSSNQFFADQSLTLTAANNNGTSNQFNGPIPSYLTFVPINGDPVHTVPTTVPLKTQNSYLTLNDVLGRRPTDQYANVAKSSAVDPLYYAQGAYGYGPGAAPKPDLDYYGTLNGTLSRPGDFHVFTINAPARTLRSSIPSARTARTRS